MLSNFFHKEYNEIFVTSNAGKKLVYARKKEKLKELSDSSIMFAHIAMNIRFIWKTL